MNAVFQEESFAMAEGEPSEHICPVLLFGMKMNEVTLVQYLPRPRPH